MINFFRFISIAKAQIKPGVDPLPPTETIDGLIMRIVDWIFVFGASLAVIFVIYGGFLYITAGSDQEKVTLAKASITNAIIGIVIIALSFVIISWLSAALDFGTPLTF